MRELENQCTHNVNTIKTWTTIVHTNRWEQVCQSRRSVCASGVMTFRKLRGSYQKFGRRNRSGTENNLYI